LRESVANRADIGTVVDVRHDADRFALGATEIFQKEFILQLLMIRKTCCASPSIAQLQSTVWKGRGMSFATALRFFCVFKTLFSGYERQQG
jgi:hypothetical protein